MNRLHNLPPDDFVLILDALVSRSSIPRSSTICWRRQRITPRRVTWWKRTFLVTSSASWDWPETPLKVRDGHFVQHEGDREINELTADLNRHVSVTRDGKPGQLRQRGAADTWNRWLDRGEIWDELSPLPHSSVHIHLLMTWHTCFYPSNLAHLCWSTKNRIPSLPLDLRAMPLALGKPPTAKIELSRQKKNRREGGGIVQNWRRLSESNDLKFSMEKEISGNFTLKHI